MLTDWVVYRIRQIKKIADILNRRFFVVGRGRESVRRVSFSTWKRPCGELTPGPFWSPFASGPSSPCWVWKKLGRLRARDLFCTVRTRSIGGRRDLMTMTAPLPDTNKTGVKLHGKS